MVKTWRVAAPLPQLHPDEVRPRSSLPGRAPRSLVHACDAFNGGDGVSAVTRVPRSSAGNRGHKPSAPGANAPSAGPPSAIPG